MTRGDPSAAVWDGVSKARATMLHPGEVQSVSAALSKWTLNNMRNICVIDVKSLMQRDKVTIFPQITSGF